MKQELKGLTALVTGASYGIGESFARELAREGMNLVLVARSKDKLEKLAEELKAAYPIRVDYFELDLSFHEAPRRLFETIKKEKLSVDLLVNNAGFGRTGYFEDAPAEKDNEMALVNINALVALTHLFIPDMLVNGKGGVINVASTAAFQPIPFLTLYSATKAFVLSFTEGLWGEYQRRGIRVLCLCPGNTRTEFHKRAGIEGKKVFLSADSGDVVRFALHHYKTNSKPTVVYGFFNWLLAQGHRFLPRRYLVKIAARLYDPVSGFWTRFSA